MCYAVLILFTLFSCVEKKQNNEYTINGRVTGYQNDYIYLKIGNSVDSVFVKDSTFVFKGTVTEPRNASLCPENPNSKAPMTYSGFIIENNPISIHLTFDNLEYKGKIFPQLIMDSIKGSTNQKILKDFNQRMENTFYKEKNDSIREKILFENLSKLIENNPKSFVSGEQLASKANFYGYLNTAWIPGEIFNVDVTGTYTGVMTVPRVVSDTGFLQLNEVDSFFDLNIKLESHVDFNENFMITFSGGVKNIFNSFS